MIGNTLGHYQIESKLGEGGMGVVYKARDTRLDRPVALKVLPAECLADPQRKQRFIREAKAASGLNHPNIITIYEIDQADGVDFMAMEYVEGRTLADWIGGRGLKLSDTLKCAVQIAEALARAHGADIIHRDLKPSNIMVRDDGLVKILDFGLAKLAAAPEDGDQDATLDADQLTEQGVVLGTLSYMSPEQAEGRKLDARSDIFSFGAVLYEMVTGRRAFQGESRVSTLAAVVNQDPKPAGEIAPGVPRDLEKIIARCLRKDLDRRFQHMGDVRIALAELKEESESGRLEPVVAVEARRPQRRGGLWLAVSIAAVLLVAAYFAGRLTVSEPVPEWKVTPLTAYAGHEVDPALSPDGNQIAFSWQGEKQDNVDVYVRLIDGGAPLRLTTDPALDRAPCWSPDGRRIALLRLSREAAHLILVPALGGAERRIARFDGGTIDASRIDWSPEGRFIVLARYGPPALLLVTVETGEIRSVTSPEDGKSWDNFPAFSPDGRTLAFSRGSNVYSRMWTASRSSPRTARESCSHARARETPPSGAPTATARTRCNWHLWRECGWEARGGLPTASGSSSTATGKATAIFTWSAARAERRGA